MPAQISAAEEAARPAPREAEDDRKPESVRRVVSGAADTFISREMQPAVRDHAREAAGHAESPLDVLPPGVLSDLLAFDLAPLSRGPGNVALHGELSPELAAEADPMDAGSLGGAGANSESAGAPASGIQSFAIPQGPSALIAAGTSAQVSPGNSGFAGGLGVPSNPPPGSGAPAGVGAAGASAERAGSIVGEFGGGGALPTPIVTVEADDISAFEFVGDPGSFVVTRHDADLSTALAVNYTVSGTATAGDDYVTLTGSVTIGLQSSTAFIEVDPLDDTTWEPAQTVIVTLSASSAYEIGWSDSATVTIYDDDFPLESYEPEEERPVVWIDSEPAIAEDGWGGPGRFEVRRQEESTGGALSVSYTVAGTATAGTDYYSLSGSVTIPGGYLNAWIYVYPLDDTDAEVFESVEVTLAAGDGSYDVSSFQSQAEAYIIDDPDADPNLFPDGPRVRLTIHNGQNVQQPVELTTSLGAFTVANMNDTDADGVADNADGNGITGELDLMKLIIHKPNPDNGGNATLNVDPGLTNRVRLWTNSNRTGEIAYDQFGNVQFATSALNKTIWVELTAASETLRDVELTLSYEMQEFSVRATGIWASMTAHRNSGPETTAVSANGNVLTLANATGFAPDNWVHIFDNGSWGLYRITAMGPGPNDIQLSRNLETNIAGGEIVRQGYWREFNRPVSLISFENRDSGVRVNGARLGIASPFYNSNAIRFTLEPVGIGRVILLQRKSGIVVDISRQKVERGWTYATPASGAEPSADSPTFPAGDIPNDDGPNHFNQDLDLPSQQDEDTQPFVFENATIGDNVFVRDMPGWPDGHADFYRWVHRWNFREFFRIKLDGTKFVNVNNPATPEGSRASAKFDWNSRIDIIDDGNGTWMRNPNAAANDNQIEEDHVTLGSAP